MKSWRHEIEKQIASSPLVLGAAGSVFGGLPSDQDDSTELCQCPWRRAFTVCRNESECLGSRYEIAACGFPCERRAGGDGGGGQEPMKLRHRIPALCCAWLLLLPSLAHAGGVLTIHSDEASHHIGQKAVVKGVVAQVSLGRDSVGDYAVFLDLGAAPPNPAFFTAVSYNLPFSALAAFERQTVSIWGTIVTYRGGPAIIISNPAQIAAIDDPIAVDAVHWRTYAPGHAPPAWTLSVKEAEALAGRGQVDERLYLRGRFRVTASGGSRAVLRDASGSDEQSPRVVVAYPPGSVPPREKARFARDARRPYPDHRGAPQHGRRDHDLRPRDYFHQCAPAVVTGNEIFRTAEFHVGTLPWTAPDRAGAP